MPKPSAKARKEKEEELKKLYSELLSRGAGESEREKPAEQLLTQEQQEEEQSQERKEPKPPAEKPTEESEHGS